MHNINGNSNNNTRFHFRTAICLTTLLFTSFLILFFVNVPSVKADTIVGGPITSDTTWTLAGSPYIVASESVSVTQGVKLTIEPGVIVRFNPGLILWVNGTLDARGTTSYPITFTSNQAFPSPGDWGNIDFRGTNINTIVDEDGNYVSGSILQHCVVEYAGWNAVYVELNSMMVDNCVIENNRGSGILILGNPNFKSWATNNTIRNNNAGGLGGGVLLRWGVIKNNIITNNKAGGGQNGGGIYASNADIINNTVSYNSTKQQSSQTQGGGISVTADLAGTILIQANSILGNSIVHYGGGLHINANTAGAEFIVKDNFISGNTAMTDGGGIYIRGLKGNVTIQDNFITDNIADSDDDHDGNGGGIYCDYKDGVHIVQDNVITENTAGERGGGIWTDTCEITGNLISNNQAVDAGGGVASSGDILSNTVTANSVTSATGVGAGVYLEGNGDFLYNSLIDNTGEPGTLKGGLHITGTPEIHHNNLYGNFPYNVVVSSSKMISGTLNYWNTDLEPEIPNQESIYDFHDDTSLGEFIYNPYLTEQEFNVPLYPPTGLTATLNGDQVELSWNFDPNFSEGWGYNVYYDTDSLLPPFEGVGFNEGDSPIDVGGQNSALLSGLEPYIDYYFGVTVYDDSGRESWYATIAVEQPDPEPESSSLFLPLVCR